MPLTSVLQVYIFFFKINFLLIIGFWTLIDLHRYDVDQEIFGWLHENLLLCPLFISYLQKKFYFMLYHFLPLFFSFINKKICKLLSFVDVVFVYQIKLSD